MRLLGFDAMLARGIIAIGMIATMAHFDASSLRAQSPNQSPRKSSILFEGFGAVGSKPPGANGATHGGGAGAGLSWSGCIRTKSCDLVVSYSSIYVPMTLASGQRDYFASSRTDVRARILFEQNATSTDWWHFIVVHVGAGAAYSNIPITPIRVQDRVTGYLVGGFEWAPSTCWKVRGGQLKMLGDLLVGVVRRDGAPSIVRAGLMWRSEDCPR